MGPTELTPGNESELIKEEKESEVEEPETDSELIEEAASKILEVILKELMDVNKVVRALMFRLFKCEVAAAVIREAVEAKFGVGKIGYSERAPHGLRRRRTMVRS